MYLVGHVTDNTSRTNELSVLSRQPDDRRKHVGVETVDFRCEHIRNVGIGRASRQGTSGPTINLSDGPDIFPRKMTFSSELSVLCRTSSLHLMTDTNL